MYRLFIDEVGNHDLKSSDDPNQRYLGLCCVAMKLDYADNAFLSAMNDVKRAAFGRTDIVLHRKEILPALPPFEALKDAKRREDFNAGLFSLIKDSQYQVITVVIDKKEHRDKYKVWRHQPYHYCLQVAIERYVMMLGSGESGDVMIESRGERENRALEASYKNLYTKGTRSYSNERPSLKLEVIQKRLSSGDIKIKPKSANIAGLQLADMLANPSVRSMICNHTKTEMEAEFGSQIVEILKKNKYRRSWWGKIEGYGTKWLP